jgi:voltage-gated potassium channel
MLLLIFLNVVAVILGTMRSFEREWASFLTQFEIFSVAVFSIDYVLL